MRREGALLVPNILAGGGGGIDEERISKRSSEETVATACVFGPRIADCVLHDHARWIQ